MKFCDLKCKHAKFPEDDCLDGSGTCRTFIALWCEKKKMIVEKNKICEEKENQKNGGKKIQSME